MHARPCGFVPGPQRRARSAKIQLKLRTRSWTVFAAIVESAHAHWTGALCHPSSESRSTCSPSSISPVKAKPSFS